MMKLHLIRVTVSMSQQNESYLQQAFSLHVTQDGGLLVQVLRVTGLLRVGQHVLPALNRHKHLHTLTWPFRGAGLPVCTCMLNPLDRQAGKLVDKAGLD